MARKFIGIGLCLPVIALLGWFVVEQWPAWTVPISPWARYPDLVAQPGGCEAANTLRVYQASRSNETSSPPVTAQQAASALETWIAQQYPSGLFEVIHGPELIRGDFGGAKLKLAWFSLVAHTSHAAPSRQGVIIFQNAENGQPLTIIHIASLSTTETCGGFAPQPRGLRARLRPYLPIILLVSYLGFIGTSALVWRWRNNTPSCP
jgi:hypothetical protein